jgi:hypothetical protein
LRAELPRDPCNNVVQVTHPGKLGQDVLEISAAKVKITAASIRFSNDSEKVRRYLQSTS